MEQEIIYSTHEYNQLPDERGSYLSKLLESGLDYQMAVSQAFEPTKAMIFGSLVDNIWLDHDQLNRDFVYWREDDRPDQALTKGKPKSMAAQANVAWLEGLRQKAKAENKILVPWTEVVKAQDLVNHVRNESKLHEAALAREWLDIKPGIAQRVGFWTDPETGIRCKGRIDRDTEEACVDLKVYSNYGPEEFPRDAAKRNLDMKAVLYMKIFKRPLFIWVVIQPEPPYHVCIYRMWEGSTEWQCGENKLKTALGRLKLYRETGIFPGVGSTDHLLRDKVTGEFTLSLPAWHVNKWV